MNVLQEFKTTKQLVLHVLEHYPETRNSDNKLYIQAAKLLGAVTLDDLNKIKLNLISVHKLRQQIQNKDGLYPATDEIKYIRNEREKEIKNYMIS